jgi:nucleotide-binding universal stress UspA family protein
MTKEGLEGKRLVVGYDASAGAERALSWAVEHAGASGRVVVVNAAKPQPDRLHLPLPGPGGLARVSEAQATLDVAFLERSDLYENAECDSEVRDGTPAAALMQVAKELDADAIVVGTRHLSRLRASTGSVGSALLEHSEWPVVIVP